MRHLASKHTHRRAGITLTQMLVVISLTGIITATAISTVITMLRQQGRSTQVWMSQQTLLQLSAQFRRDAHAARSAEIAKQNDGPALIFKEDAESARSVSYLAAENQVTRRETAGEKLLRTEIYRLPDSEVRFGSANSNDQQGRIRIGESLRLICRRTNVQPINRQTPTPRHDEQVLAVLGRDHRFEKPSR